MESPVMAQPGRDIQRLDRPSPAQLDACINGHQPVILTGLTHDQVATRCWDIPYLQQKLGDRPVSVVQHDHPRLFWDPQAGLPVKPSTFAAFAASAFERKDAGYSYLQDDVNALPVLRDDYQLPRMMEDKGLVRGKFWLSGGGLITPLHYDPVETFHWVIRGAKRFVCYRPGVRDYYPFPAGSRAPFISQVDPDHPDAARFPRFQRAVPLEFTVQAGEILYLPAYWWHQVYSQGDVNVSLNFVWFASAARSYRHLPQYLRARQHIARGMAAVRAHAQAARLERQRQGASADHQPRTT
jgi:hypothetical protein